VDLYPKIECKKITKKMKKHISTLFLIVLILSCADAKKNSPSDGNKKEQISNDTFLSANIDGKTFHIDSPVYFSMQNIITLAAVGNDKVEKIRIYINYTKGPATYTFGEGISNSDNMVYTNSKGDWLAAKTKGEGTITITEEGGYLVGVFSFTGVNKKDNSTIQITEGKFKVKLDS